MDVFEYVNYKKRGEKQSKRRIRPRTERSGSSGSDCVGSQNSDDWTRDSGLSAEQFFSSFDLL